MGSDYYERSSILAEYLFFHYGESSDYLPFAEGPQSALNFPLKIVERGLAGLSLPPASRAMDLGCAVGRSSFELTRYCQEVVGIDYSSAFIQAAQTIQKQKELTVCVVEEVGTTKKVSVTLPSAVFPERVQFFQGDALNLSLDYGEFDLVLAANLIDRLSDPTLFLKDIGRWIKKGGTLILTSPYTWIDSFTPEEKWLTQENSNFQTLQNILEPQYDFQRKEDLPMLIREHRRKYQWTVTELSVWVKK